MLFVVNSIMRELTLGLELVPVARGGGEENVRASRVILIPEVPKMML